MGFKCYIQRYRLNLDSTGADPESDAGSGTKPARFTNGLGHNETASLVDGSFHGRNNGIFGAIRQARPMGSSMPDGRIIVADRVSRELRVFDTVGVHLATWGGAGEGPGEFTNLIRLDHWPGDSLVARWSQGNRLTVFDSQGNYGRVFGMQDRDRIYVETVFPDGLVLAWSPTSDDLKASCRRLRN